MHHPGGRWLVGIVGVIIMVVGLVLVAEGVRRKFLKYLQLWQLSARARRIVQWLGVIGTTARGAATTSSASPAIWKPAAAPGPP